jgi:hypothetical protein
MKSRLRVYYRDGSTFEGTLDDPNVWPVLDVQAVVFEDEHTGFINDSSPEGYWIYRDGRWFGSDTMGFWAYMHTPGPKYVLFGSTMTREDWSEINRRAQREGFPEKSGIEKSELIRV